MAQQQKGKCNMTDIKCKGLVPVRKTVGSAGADLVCSSKHKIHPGETARISLGVSVEIPVGFFGMLVPRSSTHKNFQLLMVNSMGIIDSDYRGEICALYKNIGPVAVDIPINTAIAQLVVVPF